MSRLHAFKSPPALPGSSPAGWTRCAARGLVCAAPLLLLFASITPGLAASSTAPTPETWATARAQFVAAEQALARGDRKHFQQLEKGLHDYPLYPYLRYAALRARLGQATPAQIHAFLRQYADLPLAPRLRTAWLLTLARQQRWTPFLNAYRPAHASEDLRCYHAAALLARNGLTAQTSAAIQTLWLTGHSLPHSCDTPFRAWRKQGKLDPGQVWDRIHLAMQAGHGGLARHLGRYLDRTDRRWLTLWRRIRRDPQQLPPALPQLLSRREPVRPGLLHPATRPLDTTASPSTPASATRPVSAWILSDGLRRLARDTPAQAVALWTRPGLATRLSDRLSIAQRADIERSITLALARHGNERAAGWQARIRDPQTLHRLRVTHILAALEDHEWDNALQGIQELAPDEATRPRWRYWQARALEAMGRDKQARPLYARLAETRNYYGFLAADRLDQAYRFTDKPLILRRAALADLTRLPAIQRAHELYLLGRQVEARREWAAMLPRLDRPELLNAAQLAQQWGWHDRVISTLGRARYWDDLTLRFPLAYRQQILAAARQQSINPAWAFAVIRQESAFTTDARSHAGAVGLMQLLPRTAREVARRLRMHFSGRHALLDTQTNITLGIRYLSQIRARFGGHAVLATAAYNAGSRRVRSWQPDARPMSADLWVETVPYAETRDYLRRVLTYTVIYEQRLGLPSTSLSSRMPIVPPMTTQSAAAAGPPAAATPAHNASPGTV